MKTFILITMLLVSTGVFAAEVDLPKTILIKKDVDGTLYVHRSDRTLNRVDSESAVSLDKLNFEKVSDLSDVLNVGEMVSTTDELDRDLPRQSWYIYWGGFNGYYTYYPVYYYNYAYYPYYNYGYRGCNYYWYRYY